MRNTENLGKYRDELREMLLLRSEPVAVTVVKSENDVPAEAIRPMRDLGKHIALCQAFAMTRRDRKTIYMDKTSEWCWNPLVGFGFVECGEDSEAFDIISRVLGIADREAARSFFAKFPTLEYGKYIGILTAPLGACTLPPDIVLIYCNNAQLRMLVWAVKNMTGKLVSTELDAIDSCVYSCVPTLKSGEFRVTLPDMGEHERAAADENEIILSVPAEKLELLIEGLRVLHDRNMGYAQLTRDMQLEFPRPPFYNELFKIWNLDQGQDWGRS